MAFCMTAAFKALCGRDAAQLDGLVELVDCHDANQHLQSVLSVAIRRAGLVVSNKAGTKST